ncbi:transcription-repair coupling factor, partial [Ruminococcaceae bacterium OttesenSCG-928-N02]|nr:transcription-repair coupling factor [Ruminococcaceae bacterium OttesenSCG-928-N02]
PAAVKTAFEGHAALFAQDVENLLEEGLLCKGLTEFYQDYTDLVRNAQSSTAILCENFARSVGDYKLTHTFSMPAHLLPAWGGTFATLLEDVQPLLEDGYAVQVLAGTKRAASALVRDFEHAGVKAHLAAGPIAAEQMDLHGQVQVAVGALSGGVNYPFARLALITGRAKADAPQRSKKKNPKGLTSLEDLANGDYVVHYNHGIGVYSGIQRLDLQGTQKDYIKVNYAGKDVLYVPVTQMDLLSRYTAPGENEKVKLSKLSGDTWAKTKNRVRQATAEMAGELIELYAARQQAQGTQFPADDDWQRDFETRFDYDETADQLQAAAEIKKDMEKPAPMDRLLCGDVGVGKTEVALRAVFKAIMGGKQVAVLVPTTILAWQHYNTFIRRFEAFPVKVEMLSRFRTPSQIKSTLQTMKDGRSDVVVGTHRLLQKDVAFKDLGLLIIDEEQRFGVKHKEKLKENFKGVDVLTLSATPIPRTLNMAMNGIRDMSVIETPPLDRQPVETYVMEHDDKTITAALRRELARGGQVYYLHNRIDTIDRCAGKVAEMVPGARIGTAHGRMGEEELSAVWQDLLNGEIDILVCTTLIETGVDVPNCNTLVIENADRMGLAQLYQIRGRVGRSGRKAYAYFTFYPGKVLTEVASKRLSAIREFTTFGSGLRIAMRDMQIRGAGNLLGKSQHGHMEAVGYELYVKLLAQAVAEKRGEPLPPGKAECLIDIMVDAYIPASYIENAAGRIEIYKAIAAIETQEDADIVCAELEDRYGPIPAAVKGLVDISLIRMVAARLGIYEITQKRDTLYFYSDRFEMNALRASLRDMERKIMFNNSAKPYIAATVGISETPADVMVQLLQLLQSAIQETLPC